MIFFANFAPERSQLSDDRWDVHKLGAGYLIDVSTTYAQPQGRAKFPISYQVKSPHLFEDFDVSSYLNDNGHLKYSLGYRARCPYHGGRYILYKLFGFLLAYKFVDSNIKSNMKLNHNLPPTVSCSYLTSPTTPSVEYGLPHHGSRGQFSISR